MWPDFRGYLPGHLVVLISSNLRKVTYWLIFSQIKKITTLEPLPGIKNYPNSDLHEHIWKVTLQAPLQFLIKKNCCEVILNNLTSKLRESQPHNRPQEPRTTLIVTYVTKCLRFPPSLPGCFPSINAVTVKWLSNFLISKLKKLQPHNHLSGPKTATMVTNVTQLLRLPTRAPGCFPQQQPLKNDSLPSGHQNLESCNPVTAFGDQKPPQ